MNVFCMLASFYLFGLHSVADSYPPGGVHPALAAGLLVVLVAVPVVGQLCPARVSFLFAFRPYAGNWFFAWHVVATPALPKLRRLKTAESLLFEENDPASALARQPLLSGLCGEHAWPPTPASLAASGPAGAVRSGRIPRCRSSSCSSSGRATLRRRLPAAVAHALPRARARLEPSRGSHAQGAPYYAALQAARLPRASARRRLAARAARGTADGCGRRRAGARRAGRRRMRGRAPYALLEGCSPSMDVATLEKYIVETTAARRRGEQ